MKKLLLSFLFVLVSVFPSFSQKTDSGYKVFDHTSFTIQGKTYPITGVWCPDQIDKYNIMCVFHYEYYGDKYFFMFPRESQCETWIKSLTDMKELFVQYDQVAKENEVTSEIKKDVTDKFSFEGFYGEGPGRYTNYGRLVKESDGDDAREIRNPISVLYNYKDGQGSMVLRVGDYVTRKWTTVWEFRSVDDFDSIISALDWSAFKATFNKQVKKYTDQQNAAKAAEDKQKQESALFD